MTSFGKDSFRNANLGKHSLRKSNFGKAFLRKSNLGIESVHFLRESIHILEESFHFLKASMDFLKEPTDFLTKIWDVLRESVDLLDFLSGINDFETCQLDILASWPNTIHIWTKIVCGKLAQHHSYLNENCFCVTWIGRSVLRTRFGHSFPLPGGLPA